MKNTPKFNYLELMKRVERIGENASEDQLKIYRQNILNLYHSLPKGYKDYRNLLHNISIKWNPQKKGMFFMDSAYKMVDANQIENLLLREYPDDTLRSIATGSFLLVTGLALVGFGMAGLVLFPPTFVFALGLLAPILTGTLLASLGPHIIDFAVSKREDVKNFYKTNEQLNEIIDSSEKECLSLNEVKESHNDEYEDVTPGSENVQKMMA